MIGYFCCFSVAVCRKTHFALTQGAYHYYRNKLYFIVYHLGKQIEVSTLEQLLAKLNSEKLSC